MEKEFVNYEQALALKELGFDEPCLGAWAEHGFMTPNDVSTLQDVVIMKDIEYSQEEGMCLAPLKQQVFKWAEQKHSIYCNLVTRTTPNEICETFASLVSWKFIPISQVFFTRDNAEEEMINKLIKQIKISKQ